MTLGVPKNAQGVIAWRESMTDRLTETEARVVTTDATPTTLLSLPLVPGKHYLFAWSVVAKQKAGSGGTVGNGGAYTGQVAFHTVSGNATVIGSGSTQLTAEDDSAWRVAVAGSTNRAVWTVTGAANQDIVWRGDVSWRTITI